MTKMWTVALKYKRDKYKRSEYHSYPIKRKSNEAHKRLTVTVLLVQEKKERNTKEKTTEY